MICVIALIVFAILSIFSATYRPLAAEAFDCVFRKLTFRKCHTGLDKRLKGDITGKLMKKHKGFAKFVYKHFEVISWIFLLSFVLSLVYTAIGGYNYYIHGNCNGPNEDGFCIFDPTGSNEEFSIGDSSNGICNVNEANPDNLNFLVFDKSLHFQSNPDAKNEIIFVGCYACPYTRESYPDIIELKEREDVNFIYAHFPVKGGTEFISPYLTCLSENDPQLIFDLNEKLFDMKIEEVIDKENVLSSIESLGIDMASLENCASKNESTEISNKRFENLNDVGIYGTPTVFVNSEALVGPKPLRVYKRLLN